MCDEKASRPRRKASSMEVGSKLFMRSRRYITEACVFRRVSLGSRRLCSAAKFIAEQNLFMTVQELTSSPSIFKKSGFQQNSDSDDSGSSADDVRSYGINGSEDGSLKNTGSVPL